MRKIATQLRVVMACVAAVLLSGCQSVDSERIPSLPVNIALTDISLWNTYGVTGFGQARNFILSKGEREPVGFPYSQTAATGYGGVLLIEGMDPYAMATSVPLAYDLSCPVEKKADIRVIVDSDSFEAICPKCGSHYDVTMGGGAPLSGPAAAPSARYGLRRYRCLPSGNGGYIITN